MVRMCKALTFAMATAMVAGGAMAADRAVNSATAAITSVAQTTATLPRTLKEINTVNPEDLLNEPSTFLAASCVCHGWDNGTFANDAQSDGIPSHEGGAFADGVQAADDVYLNECSIWRLRSITASVVTNSAVAKARLEIRADCNGCPVDPPLYVLTDFVRTDVGTPYMMNPAYRVVTFAFPITPANTGIVNDSIVLHGGVYWISVIGISDGMACSMIPPMPDATFWGSSSDLMVKGSVPKKRFGIDTTDCDLNFTYLNTCGPAAAGGWFPVDECCYPCRDLNFVLCADECPIYYDNGGAAGHNNPGVPNGSPSQFAQNAAGVVVNTLANSRSADDFVVPNCCNLVLCYIEGCVFTNCPPAQIVGRYEIYGNACRNPSYTFGGTPICQGEATKAVPLGFNYTTGGKSYAAYRLEFHDVTCTLPGGTQYWISIGLRHTFVLNERAFFCANYDCRRPNCLIRWNDGRYLAPLAQTIPPAVSPWVPVGFDFSFLIGGRLTCTPLADAGSSTGACAADFNKSGEVSVQDLFDFLSAWFAGCQ